jgi:hypothetical protein
MGLVGFLAEHKDEEFVVDAAAAGHSWAAGSLLALGQVERYRTAELPEVSPVR